MFDQCMYCPFHKKKKMVITDMYIEMDKMCVFSSDKWLHFSADMKRLYLWRAKTYIMRRAVLRQHNES